MEQLSGSVFAGELSSPHMFDHDNSHLHYRIYPGGQQDHVIIDIDTQQGDVGGDQNFGNIGVRVDCPQFLEAEKCAQNNDIFTFHLELNGKPVARSNFGPLMVSDDLSEVSLYLAGPRVLSYGMSEFVWNRERHVTQFYYNKDSSVHLPLVIGMLPDNDWFFLHLDTNYPGEVVINSGTDLRPVVTWRTMGGPLRLHLVTGETLPALLRKQADTRGPLAVTPSAPHLGYQLCRDTGHPRSFKQDVEGMEEANIPLQFDGDCIDQQLVKEAFSLNTESFSSSLNNHLDLLARHNKHFTLPLVIQRSYNNQTGHSQGCIRQNSTSSTCYMGKLYDQRVMFPDMNRTEWMEQEYDDFKEILETYNLTATGDFFCFSSSFLFSIGFNPSCLAVHVHSTAPLDTESLFACGGFWYVPRGVDLRDGLVCQRAWLPSHHSNLAAQHKSYSLEMSGAINKVTGSYQWSGQHSYGSETVGGYLGTSVPASWAGLAASLREVLLLGLAGQGMVSMPVCGTHLLQGLAGQDLDVDLLCLRWGQLAAFMPALRSWYSGSDNSRMPYRYRVQIAEYRVQSTIHRVQSTVQSRVTFTLSHV